MVVYVNKENMEDRITGAVVELWSKIEGFEYYTDDDGSDITYEVSDDINDQILDVIDELINDLEKIGRVEYNDIYFIYNTEGE